MLAFMDFGAIFLSPRRLSVITAVAVILFSTHVTPPPVSQVLPISNFTIGDGLAHNGVTQIFQDEKGYLWIGTGEGLSRFDGYTFKTYGSADGLRSSYVNDVTADRNGELWIGINDGGIARFIDEPTGENAKKKFVSYSVSDIPRADNIGKIVFDSENRMWCATEGGVFRARNIDVEDRQFELVAPDGEAPNSREAFVDSRGRLWFGLVDRVLKIENGLLTYFDLEPGKGAYVNGIAEDFNGRILTSTNSGVYAMSDVDQQSRRLGIELNNNQSIETIAAAGDGTIWIGTSAGLIDYREGRQRVYTKESGLGADVISVVFTDRENSLWVGTRGGGLSHRTNSAIVNYSPQLPGKAYRIDGDHEGNIFVQTGCLPGPTTLHRIQDDVISPLPFPEVRGGGCTKHHFLKTLKGDWWIVSGGVLRILSGTTDTTGTPVVTPDGKTIDRLISIYEDKAGDVWLTTADRDLYIARRPDAGVPSLELAARDIGASMILRDSRGITWLASNNYLARLRNGRVDEIKRIAAVETIQPRSLFEDSTGRIWIGTRFDGVLYTDEPDAEVPRFGKITPADGLTSDSVWAIAEDNVGGLYFGTGRGLVRYESGRGLLRHLTSVDGIPESAIHHLFKDRSGLVWVVSDGGVLRIDPVALDRYSRPAPVLISRITVEGRDLPLPETGSADVTVPELASDENSVSIQFVGLNLKGERALSYRYQLEGYDRDWSPASKQREVNFANLGPGTYRFLVKAIDQRGIESESPAVLQFQILPPFWQRWWFLTLSGLAIAAGLYALYRYRMARVIELERVRTRIATDLHDDIGSNLTRIALMSEVMNQQGPNGAANKMLPSIANIARESVASMNDIVWAISPEHDRALDLTRRMRQHAEEVFTIRDIDVAFVSDLSDSELKLMVGVRRDVLLIFKEAVNNAARHAQCTKVEIDFRCTSSRLDLRIADNGKGFARRSEQTGHGLASMERRAASLGGKLDIRSSEGDGTTVRFEMPL